ncbi:hypothetical protein SK128_023760, partial [Halocaridina rubra]
MGAIRRSAFRERAERGQGCPLSCPELCVRIHHDLLSLILSPPQSFSLNIGVQKPSKCFLCVHLVPRRPCLTRETKDLRAVCPTKNPARTGSKPSPKSRRRRKLKKQAPKKRTKNK